MKPLLVFLAALAAAQAADFKLTASPATVAWGYYWAEAKPVLRIQSGDTVEVLTMSTSNPTSLARLGVKDEDIQPEFKAIYADVPREQRGPGGHILTGPIFVEGAEPGDVLEVRIQKIKLATPYATNGFSPTRGVLPPEDFKQGKSRLIPLDLQRNVARFADGIEIPLHPFFGSMGVAPDAAQGKVDSAPPGEHAGNIDNKDMVEGTTLYIPVHAPGALFEVGDGHAGQGNGEVDITAMGTSLVGTFQFIVLARERAGFVQAGQPAIVTTSDHDSDAIRSLLPHASLLEKHSDLASDEVASLSRAPNPALAGFLFAYLTWSGKLKGELAADLLDQIFANPSVPPEVWDSMPFWLEMASAAQPPEKRAALTQRYVELAQRPDPRAARAGFAGLAIVISDEESKPLIPPELRSKLAGLYLGWIQDRKSVV